MKTLEALKEFRRYHQYLKAKRAIEKPGWSARIAPKVLDWLRKGALVIAMLLLAGVARAEITPPNNLWKGLIGEAVSEGYDGMYAVACVYKNRLEKNMPLGCIALKRRNLDEFVRREGRKVEFIAKNIVRKVFEEGTPDVTRGATHYENISAFGMPKWAYFMVRTIKIGEHTFYK